MMQSGPSLWLIILTLGALILLVAMIYGFYRSRRQSGVEEALTEAATQQEYEREDRDES